MKGGRNIIFFDGVRSNSILMIAFTAWLIAQLLKTLVSALKYRRLNFRRLVEPGGMPSSHAAFVTSLGTAVGMKNGWDSSQFAITVVFALIVMYDAAGVRRAAGKQARVLNAIVTDLENKELHTERLKELIGHTPFEVLIGALLGIVLTWWKFS